MGEILRGGAVDQLLMHLVDLGLAAVDFAQGRIVVGLDVGLDSGVTQQFADGLVDGLVTITVLR